MRLRVFSLLVGVSATAESLQAAVGKCTAADAVEASTVKFSCDALHCAKKSLFKQAGTARCVESATRVSAPCASCFGRVAACVQEHCASACLFDPEADQCHACRRESCDAFSQACSGLVALPPNPVGCSAYVKLTVTHEPIAPIEELDVLAERLV